MPVTATVGMADAKTNFSRITADANRTGIPITVFKNNKPWVEIRPLATPEIPAETLEAMAEIEQMKEDPDHQRFATAEELFSSLGI